MPFDPPMLPAASGRSVTGWGPARVAGCVLAGGRGSRLGRPKATLTLDGRTLVERAVAALVGRCSDVKVISRPDIALPELAVPVLLDRPGPAAPLTAIATALAATDADAMVVLACDLPFAGGLIDALIAAPAGRPAVARDPAGRLQPLCARYPRAEALAACEELLAAGRLAVHDLIARLGPPVEIAADAHHLHNVNTPEDLRAAESRIRSR